MEFLLESLASIDEVDAIAREMTERGRLAPLLTSELATRVAELTGTSPPLTPQTVATARAHLCALAGKGLIKAARVPRTGAPPGA